MKCETRECNNNDNGMCYYGEQAKYCPRLSCSALLTGSVSFEVYARLK